MRAVWFGLVSFAVFSGALFGCGGDEATSGEGAGGSSSASGNGSGASSSNSGSNNGATSTTSSGSGGELPGGEWETLIDGDWSLASGSEDYSCIVATVPEDMYVAAFRPIAPVGTHHTVLTRVSGASDGTYPCDASTNGENMIYGSGVGTEALVLPQGVAVKLDAGEQLLLNLHLFNTNASELSGLSGVEVRRVDEAEVEHTAESMLAGTYNIFLAPQSAGTASGRCTLQDDINVWAVGPHMHQLGTHIRIRASHDGSETTLYDDAYSFEDQRQQALASPLALTAGDTIEVDCEYNNTTDNTVTYGDSSTQEMCFAAIFSYPSRGLNFTCTN